MVHPSMSPKGVEHEIDFSFAGFPETCIHQCRRKALSTGMTVGCFLPCMVHPSMSPKGVEHNRQIIDSLKGLRASINLAERR